VRSADILRDPRYGKNAPTTGCPRTSSGSQLFGCSCGVAIRRVLGGLFFGHPQPDVFTERAEKNLQRHWRPKLPLPLTMRASIKSNRREIAARGQAEQQLQQLNETLEQRAEERARELAVSLDRARRDGTSLQASGGGVTDYAIYMLDPLGNIVNWNPGARRIKGYTREENHWPAFLRFLLCRGFGKWAFPRTL